MISAWKEVAKLPKQNRILFLTVLAHRSGTMVLPFLMLYMTKSLGFTMIEASRLFIVFGLVSILTVPVSGWLCDKWTPSRVMNYSLLGSVICLACIPWIQNRSMILPFIVIFSVVTEAFRPACMSYMAEVNSPEDLKIASSFFRFAINLGMSIGPLVGGFIVEKSYRLLFFVNACAALLAWMIFVYSNIGSNRVPTQTKQKEIALADFFEVCHQKGFLWFLISMLPLGFVFAQGESTLSVFVTDQLNLSERYYGFIFTVNTLLIVFFEIWLNVKMKQWNDSLQMILGCILIGLGMSLTYVAPHFSWVVFATVLWTFGEMIFYPSATSAALEYSKPHNKGVIMGLFTMTFSLSTALGPTIGSALYSYKGASSISVFCLMACAVSVAIVRKIKKQTNT